MSSYFAEIEDDVQKLVESRSMGSDYIQKFETLLQIRHSKIPAAIRMYCLEEGTSQSTKVPVLGQLPHNNQIRPIDEKALDTYCESWTKKQKLNGEPLKLEWSIHPEKLGKVSFHVSLSLPAKTTVNRGCIVCLHECSYQRSCRVSWKSPDASSFEERRFCSRA